MLADTFAHDPEAAFARCKELIAEIESEAAKRLGGRQLAMPGLWRYPSEIIQAHLRSQLFGIVVPGLPKSILDNAIHEMLQPLCNMQLFPVDYAPVSARRPAFNRQPADELPAVFTADGPVPVGHRNESREAVVDDSEDLLGGW